MINESFKKLYIKTKKILITRQLLNQIIAKNVLLKIVYIIAGIDLKKSSAKCKTVDDYVNLALSYQYFLFNRYPFVVLAALQKKTEITKFFRELLSIRPKVILEIGTANGGCLFLLSKFSSPDALFISVDLPVEPYIGGFDYKNKSFYKSFATNNQKMVLIRRDSHDLSTLQKVKKILKNKQIDVLFIDGDHTYEGVRKDFEMYAPLVKKNGLIAFHDIVVVDPKIEKNNEVNKFWNKIKENFQYLEIVEDWNQGWAGIGIIKKN